MVIKSKLKDFLGEVKKFKAQTILVLEYKEIDHCKSIFKIVHSSDKLIFKYSENDKEFGSMHQSVMTKIKNCASEYYIVKTIGEHGTRIFKH